MTYRVELRLSGPDLPSGEPAASVAVEAETPARAMIQLIMQLPGELADAWRERLEASSDPEEQRAIRVDISMASALEMRLNA